MLRLNISVKLILISTLLLCVVVGVFALLDNMKSSRVINTISKRLQQEKIAGLRKTGIAQLQLLSETSRIALLESEYETLQNMLINMSRQDERVTGVAVIDRGGRVLAHNDKRHVGKTATGSLKDISGAKELTERMGVDVNGIESIALAKPVEFRGSRLCVVFIAFSLRPLKQQLAQTKSLKEKEMRATFVNTVTIGVFAIAVSVLLAVLLGLSISRPIRALVDQVNRIASGEFQARVKTQAGDEVGQLGDRFNYMAGQVQRLMEEIKDKAAMEKEIELATAVQSTIMPKSSQFEVPGLALCGQYKPASKCSGDWWTFSHLPDGRVLVLIGDVTGHGIAPAIMTAVAKGALSQMVSSASTDLTVNSLLVALNSAFFEAARGKMAMTCCCSIYDPATHTLSTANAGHNFPYKCQPESEKINALVARGKRLGAEESISFKVRTDELSAGDIVVWYTDGIVESVDEQGNEYSGQRLRSMIVRNSNQSPEQMVRAIFNDVKTYHDQVPQKDDVTLVVSKVI